MGVNDDISGFIGEVVGFVSEHPVGVAVGTAGAVGTTAGLVALGRSKSKKKTTRKIRTTKGRARDRRYISKQKHERKRVRKRPAKIYGKKGKYYSRKPLRKAGVKRRGKVYYARKTGQPYIILSSGKAKFIKGKRRK